MAEQANAQASEAAALAETQKQQVLTEQKMQLEKAKSDFEIQRMQTEAEIEREQMAQQFEYDMKLKQMDVDASTKKEAQIEDRKDQRTKIQATQQSKMISQRQTDSLPTDFEKENQNGVDIQQFM